MPTPTDLSYYQLLWKPHLLISCNILQQQPLRCSTTAPLGQQVARHLPFQWGSHFLWSIRLNPSGLKAKNWLETFGFLSGSKFSRALLLPMQTKYESKGNQQQLKIQMKTNQVKVMLQFSSNRKGHIFPQQ